MVSAHKASARWPMARLPPLNLPDLAAVQNVAHGPKHHLVRRCELVAFGKADIARTLPIGHYWPILLKKSGIRPNADWSASMTG